MERENIEKYLKENLKGFRVEARKLMTGGWTILNSSNLKTARKWDFMIPKWI